MFDFETEAPPLTDEDLAIVVARAKEREQSRYEYSRTSYREMVEAQQDLRWATKG